MSDAQIPVKYIGPDPFWHGLLYGVKLRFDNGQTRPLPEPLALKFLTHHDTFQLDDGFEVTPKSAEQETQEALTAAKQEEQAKDEASQDLYDVLDRVDLMEKEQLAEFASRYGTKLDARRAVATLRTEVKQLVNLRGLI
jgi:hypothetical protein